jgi:hypothetical protein
VRTRAPRRRPCASPRPCPRLCPRPRPRPREYFARVAQPAASSRPSAQITTPTRRAGLPRHRSWAGGANGGIHPLLRAHHDTDSAQPNGLAAAPRIRWRKLRHPLTRGRASRHRSGTPTRTRTHTHAHAHAHSATPPTGVRRISSPRTRPSSGCEPSRERAQDPR